MKHIILLGDGMADHAVKRLQGKTLLQHAKTPYMDRIAREGKNGRLMTIPEGYLPGSEVANTAILGYNLDEVYEGRGPLEAASIGYKMQEGDLALRCNIITLQEGRIVNHHGGHLSTEEGTMLIEYLQERLGGDIVRFVPGIQYRHLLIISGGNKHIVCAPPHDHPTEKWQPLLVKADTEAERKDNCKTRLTAQQTADLVNGLILKSQTLLSEHPFNKRRMSSGKILANSIWPWSGGYKPKMSPISEIYPSVKEGDVISAVDLIRGIGSYAGLNVIKVEGATGLYNTNYEGKAWAAVEALKSHDFVFLHVEASDEAGHDGDLELKLRTIEDFDRRIVKPVFEAVLAMDESVAIAVLPDHPTPVEMRTHVAEAVPFALWHKGIEADQVTEFNEVSAVAGGLGMLHTTEFMRMFMSLK